MKRNEYSIFFNVYKKQGLLRDNSKQRSFSLNEITYLALRFIVDFELMDGPIPTNNFVISNVFNFLKENQIFINEKNYTITEFNEKIPLKTLQIEVTNKCNLRCKHCYLPSYSETLDTKILYEVIRDAKKLGVMDIDFTGGEPFISPDICTIIETVLKNGMNTTIFTNAIHIPNDFKNLIHKYNGIKLKISLDGCDEKMHDEIRGKGTFRRTIKNIQYFRKNNIPVTINVVLNSRNVYSIDKFLELFSELDVKYAFDRFLPFERSEYLSISDEEYNNAILSLPSAQMSCNVISESFKESFYCGAGNSYVYINSTGEVGFCPTLSSTGFCGGNIKMDSLSNIWLYSKFFNHIRNIRCKYYSQCPNNYICQGGCRSRAQFISGGIGDPDIQECKLAYRLTGILPKSMENYEHIIN